MDAFNLTRVTELAQSFVSQYLKDGDIVVDCTMGNGNDTLFLARGVGKSGKVFSFDIQRIALEKTKSLLESHGLLPNVILINDSHEEIDKYINQSITVAMFNLGFLPGGNHNNTTKAVSTINSIKKCIYLLKPKGIITVAIYTGHPEGVVEKDSILEFVKNLEPSKFHVIRCDYLNQSNNAPLIIAIIKK